MAIKKIRILFIGFNRSYTNPTAELTLLALGHIADLQFYGPGYSNNNELDLGIQKWVDRHAPFDILLTDSYVLETENIAKRKHPFKGDFIRFSKSDYYKYAASYQSYFLNSELKKVFIANFDTYGIETKIIDRLIRSNTYVIDGGTSTNRSKTDVEKIYGESCYGNNNWFEYVSAYKSRLISIPHFIASTEFDFTPLQGRKIIFNVIGAPYSERKFASQLLPRTLRVTKKWNYLKLAMKFKTMDTMSEELLLNIRADYMRSISNSRLCYCSGGPWLSPVRKYFEIPARGAISIGWPCNGFENLGFEDKKNFIAATSNEQLSKTISEFDEVAFQKIASAGRELIWNKHSDFARVKQLQLSFEKIINGEFSGSFWSNGNYLHF